MSDGACCRGRDARRRAGLEVTGFAAPTVLLALLPKCPACIVAYVAAATGLGLSLAAARGLSIALTAACVLSLAWLALRRARRWLGRAAP